MPALKVLIMRFKSMYINLYPNANKLNLSLHLMLTCIIFLSVNHINFLSSDIKYKYNSLVNLKIKKIKTLEHQNLNIRAFFKKE